MLVCAANPRFDTHIMLPESQDDELLKASVLWLMFNGPYIGLHKLFILYLIVYGC